MAGDTSSIISDTRDLLAGRGLAHRESPVYWPSYCPVRYISCTTYGTGDLFAPQSLYCCMRLLCGLSGDVNTPVRNFYQKSSPLNKNSTYELRCCSTSGFPSVSASVLLPWVRVSCGHNCIRSGSVNGQKSIHESMIIVPLSAIGKRRAYCARIMYLLNRGKEVFAHSFRSLLDDPPSARVGRRCGVVLVCPGFHTKTQGFDRPYSRRT